MAQYLLPIPYLCTSIVKLMRWGQDLGLPAMSIEAGTYLQRKILKVYSREHHSKCIVLYFYYFLKSIHASDAFTISRAQGDCQYFCLGQLEMVDSECPTQSYDQVLRGDYTLVESTLVMYL